MDDMVVTLCGRESVAGEYKTTEEEEVSLCRVLGVVRARIRLFVTHATRSPWYVVGVCACACARCVCVCVCVCEYAGVHVRLVRAVARRRRRGWTTTDG